MSVADRVAELCEPVADDLGVHLFDVEYAGGRVVVTLDREGGVDLELIAEATRRISRLLDEHDPISGRYTLEVSTPGLERVLRTPAHFVWAIGRDVSVKVRDGAEGTRRVDGLLRDAGDDAIVVEVGGDTEPERIAYDDIDRARTVFTWGPAPKPGGKRTKETS